MRIGFGLISIVAVLVALFILDAGSPSRSASDGIVPTKMECFHSPAEGLNVSEELIKAVLTTDDDVPVSDQLIQWTEDPHYDQLHSLEGTTDIDGTAEVEWGKRPNEGPGYFQTVTATFAGTTTYGASTCEVSFHVVECPQSLCMWPSPTRHGDYDCDGSTDTADALMGLQFVAALPYDQPDFCFNLGSRFGDVIIGDIDCDDDIDAIDQLGILRDVAELLPLLQNEPCPDIGILLD